MKKTEDIATLEELAKRKISPDREITLPVSLANVDSRLDLFFAPEKHEGWINIFRGKDNPFTGNIIFASKEEAEESGRHCCGFTKDLYIISGKVEWEE